MIIKGLKRGFLLASLTIGSVTTLLAQTPYSFKEDISIPCLEVKDQGNSGTCWSFSGVSFLESEMIRLGGPSVNLSEMFVVHNSYLGKIRQHIRMRMALKISQGGEAHDVIWAVNEFGIMPREAYMPVLNKFNKIDHQELERKVIALANDLTANSEDNFSRVSPLWKKSSEKLLNEEMGKMPETFTYDGKTYTPKEFASEVVKFNAEDYVAITSFTHHPFYKQFVMELPDNWLLGQAYNVTIDELVQIADNALANGFSFIWGADISESAFFAESGVAVVPETRRDSLSNAELKSYGKLTQSERFTYGQSHIVRERYITQEERQDAFDNYETTDDHGMHIVGTVRDTNGNQYYKVKNSWGANSGQNGYIYASKAYFRYKTIDILVHKDAIPLEIRKKLGL